MAQAATSTQRGSMTGTACSIAVSALASGKTSADTANCTSGSVRGYHSICLTCRRLAKVWLTMWNSCHTCIIVQFGHVEQLSYMHKSIVWPCETAALHADEFRSAMWNSCPTCRSLVFFSVLLYSGNLLYVLPFACACLCKLMQPNQTLTEQGI